MNTLYFVKARRLIGLHMAAAIFPRAIIIEAYTVSHDGVKTSFVFCQQNIHFVAKCTIYLQFTLLLIQPFHICVIRFLMK